MNSFRPYQLIIHRLSTPFNNHRDLKGATLVQACESDTPFAAFAVGQTIADGPGRVLLGTISHITHFVGNIGPDNAALHETVLYLNPDGGPPQKV